MTDPDKRPDSFDASLIGRVVENKYRVVALCGRGGMGSVYEAQNVTIGKRVALKFIDAETASNRDGVQRFLREAQAASAVESAHIVQVFDVGELDGRPFIVMELLRGETLGARMHRLGTLPPAEAVHIAVQVLRGLHRAHAHGIVHRDLKPENVFLVETDDDPLFAKLVDFGISKITRRSKDLDPDTITQEGVVLGTPFYMAPEQAQGLPDLDERADLWSLGAILYECLAGQRPFAGDTYEQVIIAICTRDVADIRSVAPDTPKPLAAVIARALSRDRNERFATARAFLDALHTELPDLVPSKPASFDAVPVATVLSKGGVARERPASGPRTGVSWSAGQKAALPTPQGAEEQRGTPRAKLMMIGGVTALLAFALTVGLVSRFRQTAVEGGSAMPGQGSVPVLPSTTAELRIVADAPGAVVLVDDHPSPDRIVRGIPGSEVRVQVTAPGYAPQDKTIRLEPGAASLHVAMLAEPVADAAPSSTSSAAARPIAPSVRETPTPPTKPESSSLTGGLRLKTDIP